MEPTRSIYETPATLTGEQRHRLEQMGFDPDNISEADVSPAGRVYVVVDIEGDFVGHEIDLDGSVELDP